MARTQVTAYARPMPKNFFMVKARKRRHSRAKRAQGSLREVSSLRLLNSFLEEYVM